MDALWVGWLLLLYLASMTLVRGCGALRGDSS